MICLNRWREIKGMKPAFFEDPKRSSNILYRIEILSFKANEHWCHLQTKGVPHLSIWKFNQCTKETRLSKKLRRRKSGSAPGRFPTCTPPFFFEKSTRKFLSRYKNHRVLLRLLWLMAPWPCHGIGRLKLLTKLRQFPDRREVSSFQRSTHLNTHTSPIHQVPSWNHSNISNVFWKSLEWRHNIEIYRRYEMNIEDWMYWIEIYWNDTKASGPSFRGRPGRTIRFSVTVAAWFSVSVRWERPTRSHKLEPKLELKPTYLDLFPTYFQLIWPEWLHCFHILLEELFSRPRSMSQPLRKRRLTTSDTLWDSTIKSALNRFGMFWACTSASAEAAKGFSSTPNVTAPEMAIVAALVNAEPRKKIKGYSKDV